MARVFIEGFEAGDLGLWEYNAYNYLVGSAITGSYMLYVPQASTGYGGSDRTRKNVPSSNTYYASFHLRQVLAQSTWRSIFFFGLDGNDQCSLALGDGTNYRLAFVRGTTAVVSGSKSLLPSVDYHIQIYAYIHDSAGRFVVKVDGLIDIDYTGDTKNLSSDQINQVGFGAMNGGSGGCFRGYVDNFVLDNAAYPGQSFIAGIMPNGAGYSTQWTPSAGSNYACVDEVPPSDADYVYTNTVGNVDTYALSDLPGTAVAVKAVQVQARARKEGVATPQNLDLAVRTTGGDYFSADKVLSTSFVSLSHLWETNPGTAAAWTVSEVNAMEAGVKAAA